MFGSRARLCPLLYRGYVVTSILPTSTGLRSHSSIAATSSRAANVFRSHCRLPTSSIPRRCVSNSSGNRDKEAKGTQTKDKAMPIDSAMEKEAERLVLTEEEWRQRLSPQEYHVLREKGTEPPQSGEYDVFDPPKGYFSCRGCGNPLYTAAAKFHSGCGWPSFDKCVAGSVNTRVDKSFGMTRIEILCSKCDGHLGHVFEGERFTETDQRHCVNSLSMQYHPDDLPEGIVQAKLQSNL